MKIVSEKLKEYLFRNEDKLEESFYEKNCGLC